MKTVIIISLLILGLSTQLLSQNYKKLRVGFGIGYLVDQSGGSMNYELGYRINDNFLVGYKGESAFVSDNTILSKTIYYQYYLTSANRFRPFAGLGAGIYTPTGTNMGGGCSPGPGFSEMHASNIQSKFGVAPRLGFDYRHFTLTVEWNIVGKSSATLSNNLQPTDDYYVTPYTDYFRNSYGTVKIGFFFGGGRKAQ